MFRKFAIDPLDLSRALIRCPSVTPEDAGALDVLQEALLGLGFACNRLPFAKVDNLYARIGTGEPVFCFAGHTDVVPAGDAKAWSADPFGAEVKNGRLYGRGACDMKAAVACFVSATADFLATCGPNFGGSISFLITGDEEGPAIDGTCKVLDWMAEKGETISACLVGEPTNPKTLGEMIKIGRRGSLNATLTVRGIQGHTGYPHLADNPIPRLLDMLKAVGETPLDAGNKYFQPSHATLTSVDVGNTATNVIPAQAVGQFNIRYNHIHTGAGLESWIRERCDGVGGDYDLEIQITGEPFFTPPGPLTQLVADVLETETGRRPELSTTGGTSDARFIKDYAPVIEFGMSSALAHKMDEFVPVDDIFRLAAIYRAVLDGYFSKH